ncbi:MAG: hypothetical protein WB630_02325, partial [Candidatus Acidiferrales bacterium]
MNLDSRSTRLRLLWLCSVLTLMVSARSTAAQRKGNQVAVLVGAGDIADCADLSGAEATAKLLDQIPGTVFTAG